MQKETFKVIKTQWKERISILHELYFMRNPHVQEYSPVLLKYACDVS